MLTSTLVPWAVMMQQTLSTPFLHSSTLTSFLSAVTMQQQQLQDSCSMTPPNSPASQEALESEELEDLEPPKDISGQDSDQINTWDGGS